MKLKLKNKILLLYLVVGLCLALVIVALFSSKLKKDRFDTVYAGYQHRLSHIEFALNTFLEGVKADLRGLALNEFVRSKNDEGFTNFIQADPDTFQYHIGELEQRIIDLFNDYRETHTYVNSVYMGRENGSFVRSHKRAKPTRYDPRERHWYTLAKANPGLVMRTAPYSSVTSPDINVGIVTALVEETGQFYGVVGMDITLTDFTSYIENVRVGHHGYMILFDETGTVLASPKKEDLSKSVHDIYTGDLSPVFQKPLGFTFISRSTGMEYLFFQASRKSNWISGMVIPAQEIDGEIRSFVNRIVLAVLISLALLSALTLVGLQKFVIRSLKKLNDGADLIAQTGELDHPIEIHSTDEIGNLARSFNKMIDTIGKAEASLKESEAELKRHRDHLEELVEGRTEDLTKAQEKLAEAEERSRLILESAGDGIVVVEREGKITFVNPAATDMLGFLPHEFMGQSLHALIHHSFVDGSPYPKEDCPMFKSFMYGTANHVDDEVLWRKDGCPFPVEYSSTPMRRDDKLAGAVVTFRDITERKKAEEKIRSSEQRLAQIIDFFPDSAWVVDNQGKVVAWNKTLEKLTGVKSEDMMGKGNYEYALPFYGERRPVLIDLVREWNADYEKEYLSIKKQGEHLVSESYHPDLGKDGLYLSAVAGLLYDPTGNVAGAIESLRDITAIKRAEEALQLTRFSIDQAAETMFWINPDGSFFDVNDSALKRLGYSRGEMLSLEITDLDPEINEERWFRHWEEVKRLGSMRFESSHRTKDGGIFPVDIAVHYSKYDDREFLCSIVTDITERKEAEERLRKLSRTTEQSPASVVITERDGLIEYVNPKFTEVTGYSSREVIRKNPRVLKSGRLPSEYYKELWDTILAGKEWRGEFCNMKKNREMFWEHACISPIRNPERTDHPFRCGERGHYRA